MSESLEALRATTHKKLSKYTTPQLLSKLDAGAFLKMSKEVALAILEKRNIDISKYTEAISTSPKKEEKPKEEKETTKKPVVKKAVKEEAPEKEEETETKEKSKPKAKVKSATEEKIKDIPVKKTTKTFVAIDETDSKVAAIFDPKTEGTKTSKIEQLLKLGYTPNQISKSSLNAHYSFCLTVKNKMDDK